MRKFHFSFHFFIRVLSGGAEGAGVRARLAPGPRVAVAAVPAASPRKALAALAPPLVRLAHVGLLMPPASERPPRALGRSGAYRFPGAFTSARLSLRTEFSG